MSASPDLSSNHRSRDWTEADAYRFTETLTLAQWIWEFLRRNRDYQRDWQWFSARWSALEDAYGRPPARDFSAWQRDPRAWVVAGEDGGECRIDQDKVLIECWMGAKWGFYKFPLDPDTDNPIEPERLTWREVPQPVQLAPPNATESAEASPALVSILFELDLPLRDQIERAQRHLLSRQRRLLQAGTLRMRTRSDLAPCWCLMLRYLDALTAGAGAGELEAVLNPKGEIRDFDHLQDEARQLVAGGHCALLSVIDR